MRVKTKTTQSNLCLKIILQDARIVQAEGGNRLQAIGWCNAKAMSTLTSGVKLGQIVIYSYLVSFGFVRHRDII